MFHAEALLTILLGRFKTLLRLVQHTVYRVMVRVNGVESFVLHTTLPTVGSGKPDGSIVCPVCIATTFLSDM